MTDFPSIQNNIPGPNPELKDVLQAIKTDILLSTNCHAVGTIRGVRITNGLVVGDATVDYERTYFDRQPDGSYQPVLKPYPQLIDCPVVILGGSASSLKTPIAQGDRCLILFNDRDLSRWFAGARSGPVASTRLHSFSDAVLVVGFQPLTGLDPNRMVITNGTASCGVNQATSKVVVSKNSDTLYSLLANLITAIEGITVTTSVPSTPGAFTSGTPNNSSALEAAKAALGNLLE